MVPVAGVPGHPALRPFGGADRRNKQGEDAMASLTPTGLETITYGQQGWNAIVTANMQRLNTWLGKLLPLMDSRSRTAGAVPVWNAVNGNWEPSNAVQALQTELEALKSRVAALEAAAEEPPSA